MHFTEISMLEPTGPVIRFLYPKTVGGEIYEMEKSSSFGNDICNVFRRNCRMREFGW